MIMGHATVAGGTSMVDDWAYGSSDPTKNDESSGVMTFVRVWHGGQLHDDIPMDGLMLAGVGSGTVVKNIEVGFSGGDGIKILGGAVELTYVSSIFNHNDGIDIDAGFSGKVEHLSAITGPNGDFGAVLNNASGAAIVNASFFAYSNDDHSSVVNDDHASVVYVNRQFSGTLSNIAILTDRQGNIFFDGGSNKESDDVPGVRLTNVKSTARYSQAQNWQLIPPVQWISQTETVYVTADSDLLTFFEPRPKKGFLGAFTAADNWLNGWSFLFPEISGPRFVANNAFIENEELSGIIALEGNVHFGSEVKILPGTSFTCRAI